VEMDAVDVVEMDREDLRLPHPRSRTSRMRSAMHSHRVPVQMVTLP
jgi:hypothetical protein